jgi:hypothetical protein
MFCPQCGVVVEPLPESSPLLGWFACPACKHEWSVRYRAPGSDVMWVLPHGRDICTDPHAH